MFCITIMTLGADEGVDVCAKTEGVAAVRATQAVSRRRNLASMQSNFQIDAKSEL